jgi:hypothetical protein
MPAFDPIETKLLTCKPAWPRYTENWVPGGSNRSPVSQFVSANALGTRPDLCLAMGTGEPAHRLGDRRELCCGNGVARRITRNPVRKREARRPGCILCQQGAGLALAPEPGIRNRQLRHRITVWKACLPRFLEPLDRGLVIAE